MLEPSAEGGVLHQILLVDVGNSTTSFGVQLEGRLEHVFRIGTDRARTSDELAALLLPLFDRARLKPSETQGFLVSSVVPPINSAIAALAKETFGCKPVFIGPGIRTGLSIRSDNPLEVGSDRIVNAVAARELYGSPVLVVDFGTATTFDVVNAAGEFIGGVIAPGLAIAAEALFAQAAKLYRVDLVKPDSLIGRTTSGAMQAGIYFGYSSLVEGLISRIRREIPSLNKVVATGGLANLIAGEIDQIHAVNPHLTLIGLQQIWDRNRPRAR